MPRTKQSTPVRITPTDRQLDGPAGRIDFLADRQLFAQFVQQAMCSVGTDLQIQKDALDKLHQDMIAVTNQLYADAFNTLRHDGADPGKMSEYIKHVGLKLIVHQVLCSRTNNDMASPYGGQTSGVVSPKPGIL